MMQARNPTSHQPIVLVADNDSAVCNSLKFSLELEGFTVRTYSDAATVLGSTDVASAECLVVDYKLPGMNGLPAARWGTFVHPRCAGDYWIPAFAGMTVVGYDQLPSVLHRECKLGVMGDIRKGRKLRSPVSQNRPGHSSVFRNAMKSPI